MYTAALESLARQVRRDILRATTIAGSGHPTSSLSATDLMVTLLFGGFFHADIHQPHRPNNDRLIFSKGHAAPLLYALYAAAGAISERELLTLRKFGSRLEGHPMPVFPYTEMPTGSLGQGLSVGAGMALAAQRSGLPYRTFVLLGDSEMSEGSVWEALQFASHQKLDRLTAILDVNRLGQAGPTMFGHDLRAYKKRVRAFGWQTFTVDGHDVFQIADAYRQALAVSGQPVMIIARTLKGKGVSLFEDQEGWHGKPLEPRQLAGALAEIHAPARVPPARIQRPSFQQRRRERIQPVPALSYPRNVSVSPRRALGNGLLRLAPAFPDLFVLDAEVGNSTYTGDFGEKYPQRFAQTYIAEQNMAGVAAGLAARGWLPVAATFAAFWQRAADQLRMNAYAQTHQVYIGTHAGVSIGPDGASQMGLSDLAQFRALPGSTVLYPSDAVSAEKLLEVALRGSGVQYLRATRNDLPVLYEKKHRFVPGGSHVLRRHLRDRATIVAAGITLHEALKAADALVVQHLPVRVIDLYSIKPLDVATLSEAAKQTGHLVVVEDHGPAGGMGEAIRNALGPRAGTVVSLSVTKVPKSGTPAELLRDQGIDAGSIIRTVRKIL